MRRERQGAVMSTISRRHGRFDFAPERGARNAATTIDFVRIGASYGDRARSVERTRGGAGQRPVRILVPFAAGGPSDVVAFNAAVGPAGIPRPVLERLSVDIRGVVGSREFADRTANLSIDAWGNTPAELEAWMRGEMDKWAQIARQGNIKAE
jgi:tripartite-type tricarboxylate transporter receptor subunit TctC